MATVEPINQQPISDDQELAKVLAGVSQEADQAQDSGAGTTFTAPPAPVEEPAAEPEVEQSLPAPVAPEPSVAPVVSAGSDDLDDVKKQALSELRPLVDKLDVPAEEKFDTYLLLLRSTDDKALIAPAHEAAKNIADEARRAQALLDIIKEIDFLSQNQK